MPIFELQKDGKTFEVDAPDMQSAISGISDEKSIGGFFSNLASNAAEVGGHLASAASQPLETAKTLGKTFVGMGQEFIPGQQEWETQYADPLYTQIGKDIGFAREEGGNIGWSGERLANNLYERPVDVGLSASALIAPAESLPGKAGMAARLANPINAAGKAVSTVAKAPAKIAKYYVGETSGVGPRAIEEAYRTGRVGGQEGEAFRGQMRGTSDPNAPVDTARAAVDQLRQERSQQYQSGMASVKANTTPLNFAPIDTAFNNVAGIQRFRGKSTQPSLDPVRQEISDVLDEWRNDPGAWTAEGFDALKQRVSDIGERFPYGTPQRKMVGAVTSAVKNEIVKQAPEYAVVMKAYEKASQTIDEMVRSLSAGKKSTYDTALRKLQSVLRNNAYTNWSARAKLAELIQKKFPTLMPELAGQAFNTATPRGLPGKLLSGGAVGGAGIAGIIMANPMAIIPILAGLATASPRLVGETVHAAGRVKGGLEAVSAATPQAAKAVGKTAAVTIPRVESLKHAENVLSSKVMNHVKRSENTRGPLARWLKAREHGGDVEGTARALAEAIAQEVGKPELAGRIEQELSQARGA